LNPRFGCGAIALLAGLVVCSEEIDEMKLILALNLLFMLSATFAVAQSPIDAVPSQSGASADQDALLRLERAWNDALEKRDLAWLEQNLASDMTDINSANGALYTKAKNIEIMKSDKTVYDSLELSNLNARVEGNAGIVTGINQIGGLDEQGQRFLVRFAFTDTYIKRDGRWQVWASQHTRIKP
jgi:hypothetical protein